MKQRGKILFLALAFAFLLISFSNFSQAGILKVTEEHPFLINDVWIPASQLQIGDLLTTIDGKKVRITNIEDIVEQNPFLVYNFEDDFGINNYVVGLEKIIVHNSQKVYSPMPEAYWSEEKIAEIISTNDEAYILKGRGSIFSRVMSSAIYKLKGGKGKFKEVYNSLVEARKETALQMKDSLVYHALSSDYHYYSGSEMIDGFLMRKASQGDVSLWLTSEDEIYFLGVRLSKGKYIGLFEDIKALFEDPANQKFIEAGSLKTFVQYEEIGGVKIRVNNHVQFNQKIILQGHISKENLHIVLNHVSELFDQVYMESNALKRAEKIAEIEWWIAQANPVGRGGATISDSVSLVLQRDTGTLMSNAYKHRDFLALSHSLSDYIKIRVRDFVLANN